MLALMKARRTDTQGETILNVPLVDMEKISETIRGVLELAGHKVQMRQRSWRAVTFL